MAEMPRLLVLGGPQNGREYPLSKAETTLGRHPDNTISISWDASVSRSHARIACHSGLYWLEDLGSKRGTFLTPEGEAEQKLTPHNAVLLIESSRLRLGYNAHFALLGTLVSGDESVRLLLAQLQRALNDLYAGLPYLPEGEGERQLDYLRKLVADLKAAENESELLRLIAEGIPTLAGATQEVYQPQAQPPADRAGLPPLPDSLPDPNDPDRLKTIRNVFIADIREYLPDAFEGEENPDE